MLPATASDTVVPPGTSDYLPGLLLRARASHPDLPLDPVILQSLLICLIAQPRPSGSVKVERNHGSRSGLHLILRTREEDIGLVVNIVALTLQHVLGMSTHKQKIPARVHKPFNGHLRPGSRYLPFSNVAVPDDRPDTFLRSLFFRRIPHTSFSSHRSSTPRPHSRSGVESTPRSGHMPLASPAKSSRSVRHTPHRSASYPAESTDGEEDDKLFDGSSLASSRRPLLANRTPGSTVRSNTSKGRPASHRLRTDPLPLSSLFSPLGTDDIAEADESIPAGATFPDSLKASKSVADSERVHKSGGTVSTLPRAVVVSGLEHTTAPSQRALMRVLTERRVVFDCDEDDTDLSGKDLDAEDGTWNLPDGFLMVYVCKADPHERPAILRGLIDKFSMSADISLPSSVRQSYLAYRTTHTPTPRGTPVTSSQALPHPVHSYFAAPVPIHPSGPSPSRRSIPLPAPTPQAPPVLPATELSHLRSLARPYPLAAPIFYPSVNATEEHPWTPHPSVPRLPSPYAALHPSLEHYLLDLFAATRHHPALDGTLLSARAHADAEALARAFRVLGGDTVGAALIEHEARLAHDKVEDRARGADGREPDARSWGSESAPWQSAESVFGNGSGRGYGGGGLGMAKGQAKGQAKGTGSEEFSVRGVRVHVEEDGQQWSPTPYDALLGQAADPVSMPEVSAAEAQEQAMRRSWPEVWDVSEEDVARIFPRVVSHRVRARNGPDDEILGSVMFPAVPPGQAGAAGEEGEEGLRLGWERKSVKEILVRILADV